MKINSIKLQNFRQFKTAFIEFSTDPKKNITLITGEMGAGKTTLEQSFRYVLYGDTDFGNKTLLNTTAQEQASIGEIISSEVTIDFSFMMKNYKVTRIQSYEKIKGGQFDMKRPVLRIIETDSKGNSVPLDPLKGNHLINQLLPSALSDYFFIDGEKIDRMAKNIKEEAKQDDFVKVVKNLLGLDHLYSSIEHLKKIKSGYSKQLDELSGDDAVKISNRIKGLEGLIEEKSAKIKENQTSQEYYKKKIDEFDYILRKIPEAETYQKRYHYLSKKIESDELKLANLKEEYFKTDKVYTFFIANPLMKKAIKMLDSQGVQDYGIPNLHSKTLHHILNSQQCLCGQHIEKDSDSFNRVKFLLSTVPPQSISQSVSDFRKSVVNFNDHFDMLSEFLDEKFDRIKMLIYEIEKDKNEYADISNTIDSINEAISAKKQYDHFKAQFDGINISNNRISREIGQFEAELKSKLIDLDKLKLRIDATNKYKRYYDYTCELIEELTLRVTKLESKVRVDLENNMNQHLALSYKDGFKVSINDKYKIKINVIDSLWNDKIDKSTGQGMTIIFSFIASVMKMAKEISQESNSKRSAEFPLVMDAPFSTIDKAFVPKISEVLKSTADQLIIFMNIKDSEVFLIESEKFIGKKYNLKSNSLVETTVSEVR